MSMTGDMIDKAQRDAVMWRERAEKAEAALREAQGEVERLMKGDVYQAVLDIAYRRGQKHASEQASERENQLRAALEKIAAWEMPPVFDREGKPSRMSLEIRIERRARPHTLCGPCCAVPYPGRREAKEPPGS